jgi:hypothetical protein
VSTLSVGAGMGNAKTIGALWVGTPVGTAALDPLPTPKEVEVIIGRRLRSGAEQEAALVALPCVLSCTHRILDETKAAIQ